MRAIAGAKESISLQIYGLTDPDIINLLAKKQNEGIDVEIFFDKNGSRSLPKHLCAFPVKSVGLMHRKILVIDHETILLGTANLTPQSLKMHDNLLLGISSKDLATFLIHSSEEAHSLHLENSKISSFLLPSTNQDALNRLLKTIDRAQNEIKLCMFTLTHPQIIERLLNAKNRGVKVLVAVDRNTAYGASKKAVEALENRGIAVWKSQGAQLLHHKWALIDSDTLILGSANWTKAAFEKNQDCLLILKKLPISHQKTFHKIWRKVERTGMMEL